MTVDALGIVRNQYSSFLVKLMNPVGALLDAYLAVDTLVVISDYLVRGINIIDRHITLPPFCQ